MCDYSLHAVASRPAKVGETLITTTFPRTSTRGFAAEGEPGVAVCLLPGTELAFEQDVKYDQGWIWTRTASFRVAKFGVVKPNGPHRHTDAIEFPDGSNVLVTLLVEGQRATVLQLPVVHQISGRTTKAEERGSTPAAAASAAGRSCEVPAMPSGVSATKPEASAEEAPSLTAAVRDGDANMRSGRENACGAGRTKEWNDKGRQKWVDASFKQSPIQAVCPNWARTDLCGGREVTRVPTANLSFILRSSFRVVGPSRSEIAGGDRRARG